jgi:hypothetical protein
MTTGMTAAVFGRISAESLLQRIGREQSSNGIADTGEKTNRMP